MLDKIKVTLIKIREASLAFFMLISPFVILLEFQNSFEYYLGSFIVICIDFCLYDTFIK